jgi:hypothetical protein
MLPRHIDYPKLRPHGFPASSKIYKFNPQGFLPGNIGFNDIIRFIIQTDGYWDPYSTYINLTVDVSNNTSISGDTTGNVLQVDGSGHSFFNSLIVYNKGTEIERIMEYDTLGNILNDMNYDPATRRQRGHEGVGGVDCGNVAGPYIGSTLARTSVGVTQGMNVMQFQGFNPKLSNFYNSIVTTTSGGVSVANFNLRALNANQSKCTWDMLALDYNYGYQGASMKSANYTPAGSIPQNPFLNTAYSSGDSSVEGDGFAEAFNSQVSLTCNELKFSNAIPQNCITNGVPGRTAITSHTFTIPLLSGIFGMMMPFESYKLIPMKAMQDLIFEFKMNPFALFSNNSSVPRTYRITKFEMVTELVYFSDDVDKAVMQQLDGEGVTFHTTSFYLGPIYNIYANQIPGSIQINLGFESLKSILFCFLSADYQQYSNLRKQFRLSHNIATMQLKVGTNFSPLQPIIGNAGTVLGPNNNSEFYINLMKAFSRLQSMKEIGFHIPL